MDKEKIMEAVKLLLEGIGEDVNREGLKDTPERIARMYEEIYGGLTEDPKVHLEKTFSVENNPLIAPFKPGYFFGDTNSFTI